MRELISEYLSENELRVTAVESGAQLMQALKESVIDLVLLDLRLGGEDGMKFARQIRESSEVPVIIVTGKREEADRVMGLEIAADDYVTKPFSNRELLARVRSVLRRYQVRREAAVPTKDTSLRAYVFDGWVLNVLTRKLSDPAGERVELSNGEFNLLLAFCEAPQRVLSRDQLLETSRLHGAEVYERSVDVLIVRLRRKIEPDTSSYKYILTRRGAGYLFNAEVQRLQ